MQFDELTPAQQAAYLSFMLLFRPLVGKVANVQLWIDYITTLWTSEIQTIHNLLAANAIVPDNTGYPNASPLVKTEVTAGLAELSSVFALATAANQAVAVKCVGPENIVAPGA
jgi:hypothetical protein